MDPFANVPPEELLKTADNLLTQNLILKSKARTRAEWIAELEHLVESLSTALEHVLAETQPEAMTQGTRSAAEKALRDAGRAGL